MYWTSLIDRKSKMIEINISEFEKFLDQNQDKDKDMTVITALTQYYDVDPNSPATNYLELKRTGQTICKMTGRYYPSGRKVPTKSLSESEHGHGKTGKVFGRKEKGNMIKVLIVKQRKKELTNVERGLIEKTLGDKIEVSPEVMTLSDIRNLIDQSIFDDLIEKIEMSDLVVYEKSSGQFLFSASDTIRVTNIN